MVWRLQFEREALGIEPGSVSSTFSKKVRCTTTLHMWDSASFLIKYCFASSSFLSCAAPLDKVQEIWDSSLCTLPYTINYLLYILGTCCMPVYLYIPDSPCMTLYVISYMDVLPSSRSDQASFRKNRGRLSSLRIGAVQPPLARR